MNIGIMGGTFDPIHTGHLTIAEQAYRQFDLDEVWFMPNGNPPHKQNGRHITDVKHRKEMVTLAINGVPYFKLNTYEADHDSISYSYETMECFKEMYPEYHFYFIIGADSLFAIEKWVKPERLLKTCTVLAAFRDEKDTNEEMNQEIIRLNKKFDADIRLLISPLVHISSSDLRKELSERNFAEQTDFQYLPKAVSDYIRKECLYEC